MLTLSLGQFVEHLSANNIPKEAMSIARRGFIDTIGTMIAGRYEETPQILRNTLKPPNGEATLYFSDQHAQAPEAAWINGTAAHVLDYDDEALCGHPSAVLVPAILAEAEALDSPGIDMLVAYIGGYETWAELCNREPGVHHEKGWHPTSVYGPVAAAAACSILRRLDAKRASHALAIAASQCGGLAANFGSMTKSFHAGHSAFAGIMSARLAAGGFTGQLDAIEHPRGFLTAFSPRGEVDRMSEAKDLGKTWRILKTGLNIKRYPACYCTSRAIDSMLQLAVAEQIDPEQVEEITISISDGYAGILRNHTPQTGLEAKFSIEFVMSCAIVARAVTLNELTDEFVLRKDVQSLIRKVKVSKDVERDPHLAYGAAVYDQAHVRLRSGAELHGPQVRRPYGHAENPLDDTELFNKFKACLRAGKATVTPEHLFEQLQSLEQTRARALTKLPDLSAQLGQ